MSMIFQCWKVVNYGFWCKEIASKRVSNFKIAVFLGDPTGHFDPARRRPSYFLLEWGAPVGGTFSWSLIKRIYV